MSNVSTPQFESDLMMRACRGDRGAFGQIVRLHQDRLYNALFRLVGDGDEAAELTQETFTRGLARAEQFDGNTSPFAWLLRIGLNLAVTSLRKSRRNRTFTAAVDNADPAHQTVAEAMGRLDADYRAALVLRDVEEMDYDEMSAVLDLPRLEVQSRIFRARLALRDELNGKLDGINGQ